MFVILEKTYALPYGNYNIINSIKSDVNIKRILIKGDSNFDYNSFVINSPEMLVIDLDGINLEKNNNDNTIITKINKIQRISIPIEGEITKYTNIKTSSNSLEIVVYYNNVDINDSFNVTHKESFIDRQGTIVKKAQTINKNINTKINIGDALPSNNINKSQDIIDDIKSNKILNDQQNITKQQLDINKNKLNKDSKKATHVIDGTDFKTRLIIGNNDVKQNKDLSQYTIVINPAHGGQDYGYSNKDVKEKKLTLDYSLLLQKKLQQQGFIVKLVRDKDKYISTQDRLQALEKANLAITIDFSNSKYDLELINYNKKSSKKIHKISYQDNMADVIYGLNFDAPNIKDPDKLTIKNTKILMYLSSSFLKKYKIKNTFGNFDILKTKNKNNVLIKIGNIKNKKYLNKKILNHDFQEDITLKLSEAIKRYFYQL